MCQVMFDVLIKSARSLEERFLVWRGSKVWSNFLQGRQWLQDMPKILRALNLRSDMEYLHNHEIFFPPLPHKKCNSIFSIDPKISNGLCHPYNYGYGQKYLDLSIKNKIKLYNITLYLSRFYKIIQLFEEI